MPQPNPPRDLGFVVVCLLALATALALFLLVEAVRTPISAAPAPRVGADLEAAERFYQGVNVMLVTGRPDALAETVSPAFRQHPASIRSGGGRDELVASLADVRETSPGFRLEVESVEPAGAGLLTARIRTTGADEGAFLGRPAPPEGHGGGWGPVERLRVVDGEVVERWVGDALTAGLRPLARVTLSSPDVPATRVVALLRLSIAPETDLEIANELTSRVLVAEEGALTYLAVPRDDGAEATARASGSPVAPPEPVDLATAGGLVTLPGDRYRVSNADPRPASLLAVVRYPLESSALTNVGGDEVVRADAAQLAEWFPAGVDVDVLGTVSVAAGHEENIAVGRVTMAAGTTLTWPSAGSRLLVAADAGRVEVTSDGPASSSHSPNGTSLQSTPSVVETRLLAPGESLTIRPGAEMTWRAGDDATAIVVALSPDAETAPGPSLDEG